MSKETKNKCYLSLSGRASNGTQVCNSEDRKKLQVSDECMKYLYEDKHEKTIPYKSL